MGHVVVITHFVAPAAVCFDAARDVSLHVQSASFSRERLIAPGRLDGLLDLNDLVCFEGRHFGVTQRFCARSVQLDRPRRFLDEMTRGPFKSMRHVHDFEERDGVTAMTDTLDWQAPLGILGTVADKLFLERHMRTFVESKQRALKEIVEKRLSTNQPLR